MVSTRKKRQKCRKLLRHSDELIDTLLSATPQAVEIKLLSPTVVLLTENLLLIKMLAFQQPMTVRWMFKLLEKYLTVGIDREIGNVIDTTEDRIQNAILIVIDNIITPRIGLAVRSKNSSLGQDAASFTAIPKPDYGYSEKNEKNELQTLVENPLAGGSNFCMFFC